ncbi:hypothetical protein [Microbacterium hydrocarbonoxydans]|uniref:hypothetical protein n=1 Tax=Microbacterium hydrocarbonoxydans TaxID=273678 RepID=UPI00203ABC70|nr:hypothetical protein [Microbacterium hydrocarbonoxydans]MCM3778409.1 hypothetical protein [Microbacterium hydrocarbonoxydans]
MSTQHESIATRFLAPALLSAAALVTALGVAPAHAEEEFDPLAIVEEQDLLGGPSDAFEVDIPPVIAEPLNNEVEIAPVWEGESYTENGSSVLVEDSFGIVTGTGARGTNASFIVLHDSSAPRSYDFEIGDGGTTLELQVDGSALVRDVTGQVVNFIEAPWATDAEGVDVATHYTVAGNVLTQHVDLEGATFPVTADPTMGCGVGWCSVYFNRSETNAIASGGPAVGAAITAACAKAGAVIAIGCGISLGIALSQAGVANKDRNCIGILFTPLGSSVFIEPRGTAHCR